MKRWLKTILVVFLFIVVGIVSFFAGGIIGFVSGFSYNTAITGGIEGFNKVSALRAIREGRTERALDLLETGLDINIIEYSLLEKRQHLFNIMGPKRCNAKFMIRFAKYRKEFPSYTLPELEKLINDILAKYEPNNKVVGERD